MSAGFYDTNASDDVTLNGLEKWTCHLYENLGWMGLAYETDNKDKVSSYLISIKKLKLSIESRLKIITSEDAKIDLTTLLSKVKHLYMISSKLFDKHNIRKSICNKCAFPIESTDFDSELNSNSNQIETLNKNNHKGGFISKKIVKPSKKMSKKTSVKKLSKKTLTNNSSQKSAKKSIKNISTSINILKIPKGVDLKKLSKKAPSKTLKKLSKKASSKTLKNKDEPLIKKLSKNPSKKVSKKNASIFKKI